MKLTYLGTAAAEGWPAVFCNCEYCKKAKDRGGKNIRTRSQAIINNELLLDFPADTYSHALKNGLDLSAVKFCFVTHSHIDHFMPTDLFFRNDHVYAHNLSEPAMTLYGNEAVMKRFDYYISRREDESKDLGVSTVTLKPFDTVTAGDYTVTALPANHAEGEDALVYLIRHDGKTLLYLHDTGIPSEDFFDFLEKNKVVCDLISFDCTYVALPSGGGHLGMDSCLLLRDRFEKIGVSTPDTVCVINHFSHNGMLIHDELEPEAASMMFLTAYDGMTVEF